MLATEFEQASNSFFCGQPKRQEAIGAKFVTAQTEKKKRTGRSHINLEVGLSERCGCFACYAIIAAPTGNPSWLLH